MTVNTNSRMYAEGRESVDRQWNAIDCRDHLDGKLATPEQRKDFMQGRRDAQDAEWPRSLGK